MSRNGTDSANNLQEAIRRQFGSAGTTRFVRSLPTFHVENGLPERFVNLLTELDRAESDGSNAGYTSGER